MRFPSRLMVRSSAAGCCSISASMIDIRLIFRDLLFRRRTVERFFFDQAFAFLDDEDFIDADTFETIDRATRPADLYEVYPGSLLQPEVEPEIVVRDIAGAAADFVNLR